MNAQNHCPTSERGMALIVVLLMLAVLSGLTTGFAMNGQTEVAMSANEEYYAGARAAAEAGLNRAFERIMNDTANDLLLGADQLSSATEGDAVNADNGSMAFLLAAAGPYPLDAAGQYSYDIDILDDDDPQLYATPLTAPQLAAMGENGDRFINTNERLILRATGYGPKNTTIRIMRELFQQNAVTPPITTTLLANPAILVNGDLAISGNITVTGAAGNVHANGNLTISGGSASVSGDATATGTYTVDSGWEPDGAFGGGRDAVNVPDIQASSYASLADYILHDDGTKTNGDGSACSPCPSDWTFSGGTWSISGNSAPTGTFYVEGKVAVSGSPGKKGAEIAMSIIAEGSITITGTPRLKPENGDKIQFVTNGDLIIGGNVDLDAPGNVDGQIFVREQLSISGNPDFQGRVMVQNVTSVFKDLTTNSISGNPTITYNGSLGAVVAEIATPGTATFVNNVRGWMEQ
jgi:Tfp pilus assembly protein PilX/cytoskeletal protein CcmA (bactofilin family)